MNTHASIMNDKNYKVQIIVINNVDYIMILYNSLSWLFLYKDITVFQHDQNCTYTNKLFMD